jgi:hypothetical protein
MPRRKSAGNQKLRKEILKNRNQASAEIVKMHFDNKEDIMTGEGLRSEKRCPDSERKSS